MTNGQKKSAAHKSFRQIVADAFKELAETLAAFVKAPKALTGINVPYVLEGLAYFGILTILGNYCSENVGLTDPQAGWVYGGVTGGITFAMLLLGFVVDKIGVRTSLILSLGAMAVGRTIISLSGTIPLGSGVTSPMFLSMSIGLLVMVTAYGLYQPAAYTGVKRYTNSQTASMGYAVLYALMNLGAFFSGYILDFTRKASEETFPPNGLTAVFWVFTAITAAAALISFAVLTKRVDQQAVSRVKRESNDKKSMEEKSAPQKKINNTNLLVLSIFALIALSMTIYIQVTSSDQRHFIATLFMAILLVAGAIWEFLRHRPTHPFRDVRFMFFIFILIPVQTLFAHNWLTIPYYLRRAFVGSWAGEYWGVFSNINPLIIFIITPIIAGLTARANVYRMMIIGTFVMATPTFLLALGPNAWLFLLYILIMSVGEAMWQPRFLQWVAEVAPEGQTGAYMGIGQFPWFLTKVITSLYSGYFVANYIPQSDSGMVQRTGEMWLIYAIIAMISPVALWLAKSWMVKGMREKAKV
ncbi:MFS transporter [candidate division KSB1 bacterium]|nr:MFS transporter [candidate division KSB1 bacterium]RQW03285.1 MAG: MFS transporter [candidate division KSB1 bacterium]